MSDLPNGQPIDWEFQYNPRAATDNLDVYTERAISRSEEARSQLDATYEVAYGTGPLQTLDVFPAGPNAPVHLFLHGGYWRGRDKSDYSFIALPLVSSGITTVVANYDLCPKVTLEQIVGETRELLNWLPENIGKWKASPDCITASGHSAGAHLLAMAVHDTNGLLSPTIQAALKHLILVSGIYELEPVLRVSVNAEIQLTEKMVPGVSPMRHPPTTGTPVDIAVGGAETDMWIQQSKDYAEVCKKTDLLRSYKELPGENHFSIMEQLHDAGSDLSRMIIEKHTSI